MLNKTRIDGFAFLSKLSIAIVIIYMLWFQFIYSIDNLLIVLTTVSIVANLQKIKKLKICFPYLLFVLFTLSFGYLVSENMVAFRNTSLMVVKAYVFFVAIVNCMILKGGFKVIRYSTIVGGIGLGVMLSLNKGIVSHYGRTSVSNSSNENVIAMSITVAIIILFYELVLTNNKTKRIIAISIIVFLSSVVVLTGTRKSFFAIIVFIVLFLVFIQMPSSKASSGSIRRIIILVFGIVALALFINYAIDNTIIGDRIVGSGYEGDRKRAYFYKVAYNMFINRPFLGYGWGGFASSVGVYSHSTYCELISNTGLLGTGLYFTFIYCTIKSLFRIHKTVRGKNMLIDVNNMAKLSLISTGIVLALGIGTAVFYEINITILLGIVYAFSKGITSFEKGDNVYQ